MLNAQSLNPSASSDCRWKVPEIVSHIETEKRKNHSLPFLAITESWLKSYISDAQLHIPGYVVSRSDRAKRIGGGVLLYSHVNLPISKEEKYDDGICQALFCQFETAKMCFAVIYRPPDAPGSSFSDALQFLTSNIQVLDDDSYQLCITGDFNLSHYNWTTGAVAPGATANESSCTELLLQFMTDHLMNQYVLCPTRKKSTLDLFITNDDRLVMNVSASPTKLSDHDLVDVMLAWNPLKEDKAYAPNFDKNSFRGLDFQKADFQLLNSKLHEVDWDTLRSNSSFEEFPSIFTKTLLEVCASTVPLKSTPTGKPRHMNALRRKKKRLEARHNALLQFGKIEHAHNVKIQLALVHYDIKEEINKRIDEKESKAIEKIKSNSKYFYSYAKQLAKVKSSISMLYNESGTIVTDSKGMADILQNQFSSVFSNPHCPDIKEPSFPSPHITSPMTDYRITLTDDVITQAIKKIHADSSPGPDGIPVILLKNCSSELCVPIRMIWSESLDIGVVPQFYKQSYISPLFKKGNRAQAVNYRPVALTSHIIKVYERIVRESMVQFIESNEILCSNQHGFRSRRSCLTQLLSHFDDVLSGLVESVDVDAIYLDYAKAFDKVDHRLLLAKMRKYGFHEKILTWIESFLSNRSQNIALNGALSYASKVISGVPQGTVLGPLLFLLFVNDMEKCIAHSTIRFFADDTRILKHISCSQHVIELQKDLDSVVRWAKENNMALHEDKFEYIVHKWKPTSSFYELPFVAQQFSYSVSSGKTLYPVELVKDLGITVSSDMSWSTHVHIIASRAKAMASWVLSAFRSRDKVTMLTLYKSLVRSHLEYCCPLWSPYKISDIQTLEAVQRTFTARIWGVQHLDYWSRIKSLNLMSLQRRRERYIIIQMWKTLYHISPNDVGIQFLEPSRHGIKAKIPALNKSCTLKNQSLYDHSFAVIGPRLWNTIPGDLHSIADPYNFKVKLTTYLKSIPDQPPVSGYCCPNNNSLLEWQNNKAALVLSGQLRHDVIAQ